MPRSPFSWSFDITFDDGARGDVHADHAAVHDDETDAASGPTTTLELRWLTSAATFELRGRRYDLVRAPGFGEFQLVGPTGVLATATKPNPFTRRFEVEVRRGRYTMAAVSPFSRRFVLREDGREVGAIAPDSPLSRRCHAALPDELTASVRVFLLWLVVLQWRSGARH